MLIATESKTTKTKCIQEMITRKTNFIKIAAKWKAETKISNKTNLATANIQVQRRSHCKTYSTKQKRSKITEKLMKYVSR